MRSRLIPARLILAAAALIKANKDFGLLILPNQAHGCGNQSAYRRRGRWDYFVKRLLGVEPPKECRMQQSVVR